MCFFIFLFSFLFKIQYTHFFVIFILFRLYNHICTAFCPFNLLFSVKVSGGNTVEERKATIYSSHTQIIGKRLLRYFLCKRNPL